MEIKDEHVDHVDESGSFEAMPAPHQRDKRRSLGQKIKGDQSATARLDMASNKMPKSGKVSLFDVSVVPEVEEEAYKSKSIRKKPKIFSSKVRLNMNTLFFHHCCYSTTLRHDKLKGEKIFADP